MLFRWKRDKSGEIETNPETGNPVLEFVRQESVPNVHEVLSICKNSSVYYFKEKLLLQILIVSDLDLQEKLMQSVEMDVLKLAVCPRRLDLIYTVIF